ncbi:uncharacterized protein L3040_009429 [Drepanopeziza brunnea f. sp. 'multigermtubi']|nr:hypothetical protein L3040_009429 [Drepanopeziza brunnea f. sp. 'multigermtubi']
MSDNETSGDIMSINDFKFLVTCLKNTTGGSLVVDIEKVAEASGMKNPRSAQNKIGALRKKWGINMITHKSKDIKDAADSNHDAAAAAGPSISRTPAPPKTPKGRVTKTKAAAKKAPAKKTPAAKGKTTARGKKAAVVSPVKATKVEKEDEEEMEDAQESQ